MYYNGRFYTRGRIIRLDELGQHFVVRLVMRLNYKDGHKTHFASRPTTFRSASFKTYFEGKFVRRIMRLVPVFILETHNQTNYKYLRKFVQTDNASSSMKTVNECMGFHLKK